MMDVVATFPPTHGQAAAKVGNEEADESVHYKVVCDGAVTGVMCGKHDLVLTNVSTLSAGWGAEW